MVLAAFLLAFVIAAITWQSATSGSGGGSASGASSGSAANTVRPIGPADTAAQPPAGMDTVAESTLPVEARQVVRRLETGGTFHHRKDGATFADREGRLPVKPSGYYKEYTVATPGSVDRGARRIIAGQQSELYYTDDHYSSFQWIVRGPPS